MTENQFTENFSYIEDNLKEIQENIETAKQKAGRTDEVKIMAVTKTVPYEAVNYAIKCGIDLIGENRVQEYLSKADYYTKNIETHFIGHLQTNKIKYIADKVDLVQSVDSIKLASELNKAAKKAGRVLPILIEINCEEESKSGVAFDEAANLIYDAAKFENLCINGLMTIPPIENSEKFFAKMQALYIDIKSKKLDNIDMKYLSMGMSGDYMTAIQYGANIVRIGTRLFGARK